jgi:glycosyltransferase involved in cell wall biosynthesis
MNVHYTITTYPPSIGGAQIHTHEVLRRLTHAHQVRVSSFWDDNRTDWLLGTTVRTRQRARRYTLDGVDVTMMHFSPMQKARMLPAVPLYFPLIAQAAPWISREVLHVLRTHCVSARPDVVHNSRVGREPLSMASLHLARELGVPFVLTTHHHPRFETYFHRVYHRLIAEADAVIARTRWERERLITLGARPERVVVHGVGPVLANTNDPARFIDRYGLRGRRIVLFVGHKYRYKGFEAMVNALPLVRHSVPEAVMVFIGPPTEFSERYFDRLGPVDGMLELPAVDLQTKTDALAACDVLCLPSRQEAFGGVFTQAWSLNKPVIGGRIPAIAEVIDDGRDGFLSDQVPEELAARIIDLLSTPGRAADMGRRGRQKVERLYAWDVLARRLETLYTDLRSGRLPESNMPAAA